MFGLIMGAVLGIGGIAAGIKRSKDLNDIKNWSIGRKSTNTYYDYYKRTDRDILTDKPVDIVSANNGTNHTLVVDRSTEKVLRNASLREKRIDFNYGKSHLGEYIWDNKAMLQYTSREMMNILNYQCVHLEKYENYSQRDRYLNIYRHFGTGKLCIRKSMDENVINDLTKEVRIWYRNSELHIVNIKDCYIYYDLKTGEVLDLEFGGGVKVKYPSLMDECIKEKLLSYDEMKKYIDFYKMHCRESNKYITSYSDAYDKIVWLTLV